MGASRRPLLHRRRHHLRHHQHLLHLPLPTSRPPPLPVVAVATRPSPKTPVQPALPSRAIRQASTMCQGASPIAAPTRKSASPASWMPKRQGTGSPSGKSLPCRVDLLLRNVYLHRRTQLSYL